MWRYLLVSRKIILCNCFRVWLWCFFCMKWLAEGSALSLILVRDHFLYLVFLSWTLIIHKTVGGTIPGQEPSLFVSAASTANTEVLIWSYASEILLDQVFHHRILKFDWTLNCILTDDVMLFDLNWKNNEFKLESTFILVPQTHRLTKSAGHS